ncbi:MAG: hypothetical protein IK139_00765 [Lachnospiraceae bacterium]|nr:hypothetical protein [Lachnospiraceae bacterium]
MKKITIGYGIPLRDDKFPMSPDVFDPESDEKSELFRYMMSHKMRNAMMSDEERTSPDTFACDRIFLDHFITDRMMDDFSLIARDFLLHEYPNIEKHEMVKYLDTDAAEYRPDQMFERYILNLMMNAVNSGSEYTKNLFLYLHKTYYNKEYKQLKKFGRLSGREVLDLASPGEGGLSPEVLARVLTISRMYGKEIGLDCNFMYLLLSDYNECFDHDPVDWEFIDEVTDSYKDCLEEVHQIFDSDDEMYDMYKKCDKFMFNLLRTEGFTEDYVVLCDDNDDGIQARLGRTLAILKKTYRNRTFTGEELILYAAIYQGISALLCTAENMENRLEEVLYGERGNGCVEDFPAIFHPEDVAKGREKGANKAPGKKDTKKDTADETATPRYKEEILIAEIGCLHRKIHEQEGNIKELRSEIAGKCKLSEEITRLRDLLDVQQKELSALREHVYNLTEDDEARETVSVEEMRKYLNTLHIIIVGGHKNWQQKMKHEFPDWTFIDATVSGTVETSVVDKADRVYFFTDTISHSTYYRYMNVVRERNLDFGYIHGVNIGNNIRQIYRELIRQ